MYVLADDVNPPPVTKAPDASLNCRTPLTFPPNPESVTMSPGLIDSGSLTSTLNDVEFAPKRANHEPPSEVPLTVTEPSSLTVHVIPLSVLEESLYGVASRFLPLTTTISFGSLGVGVPSCSACPSAVTERSGP